jgi:hypothetical protein
MTPEQRRITITELSGWKPYACLVDSGYLVSHDEEVQGWKSSSGEVAADIYGLPDYEFDLNACQKMEAFLLQQCRDAGDWTLWTRYVLNLRKACIGLFGGDIHATAAQRCEAFLRTHGKCKP